MASTYAKQKLADATARFEDDVANEAVALIESGQCAPWEASIRATEIVQGRRASRSASASTIASMMARSDA